MILIYPGFNKPASNFRRFPQKKPKRKEARMMKMKRKKRRKKKRMMKRKKKMKRMTKVVVKVAKKMKKMKMIAVMMKKTQMIANQKKRKKKKRKLKRRCSVLELLGLRRPLQKQEIDCSLKLKISRREE
jgi:hypothetical protein